METKETFIMYGDRYRYDHKLKPSAGWAQVDTPEDAWYYGTWANARLKQIVYYAEGDLRHVYCDSQAEFRDEIRGSVAYWDEWSDERFRNGHAMAIDPMLCDETRSDFIQAGLGDFLHDGGVNPVAGAF